ncbi:MAG: site-specific DNA-methyltransferase [Candidatus Lokiarchaeota archaeon]|nr:site-specific DNA-methyltransferase [Candidatus Lokiarchaeota archaeon]
MKEIADNSIQLIITSPPYGNIKDYGIKEQIGFSQNFKQYFTRLNLVWNECFRILEPKCRMVINIGDQYLRASEHGRYRIISIASKIIEDCTKMGFDFLGDIIWQKISTTNTTGGCSLMGSIYYPRNGLLTFDYEHILIFKKYEGKPKKVERDRKEFSKISLSEWKKWYVGHWKFPGEVQKEHMAMFPEELPYRIIRMFSFIGDKVLDPFTGSGTTLKVAKSLFRKGIGYEINKEFKKTIIDKINEAKTGFFKDYQYFLYVLYKQSTEEDFSIKFQDQKRKGIVIIENNENKKIILDYLLVSNGKNTSLEREILIKLEENTVLNYLIREDDEFVNTKFIIIIKHSNKEIKEIEKILKEIAQRYNTKNKFDIIQFNDIMKKDFQFSRLFS